MLLHLNFSKLIPGLYRIKPNFSNILAYKQFMLSYFVGVRVEELIFIGTMY